ncbi:porin [Vibrio superstes]|uniref:Porin n=1 Tax=Vibrio superstes NBRC 103154 TaxID=1219062 RepID=A0A511QNX9_9VIBR|nr:porin [Vibrio superstes]GEM79041.1 porin [Vibrio superstes NBRC 103154]
MKKSILAALIASCATSTMATEIYSNDTTTVGISGEVDAYFAKADINGDDSDAGVAVWAKVQMDAEQKITDKITAFASFEIEAGSDYRGTDNDASFDDILVGIKTENWGAAVGEVGDLAESLDAIQKDDITNEGNYMGSTSGNTRESGGEGIVVKGTVGPVTLVADVYTDTDTNIDNTFGFSADYQHEYFTIGASYLQGETVLDEDVQLYGASVSTSFSNLYLAATLADFEGFDSFGFYPTDSVVEGYTMGLAASYQINEARLYTTYAFADMDAIEGVDEGDTYNVVIGVDYAVADNILAFVEYQFADADWAIDDSQTIVAGVYYSF